MTTSLIEMLELSILGNITKSTIHYKSCDKNFPIDIIHRNFEIIIFISIKNFILKRLRLAIFADIIKIAITLIKTNFQDTINVKRITNYVLKCNFYFYFLIKQKLLISAEKCQCPLNLMGVFRDLYSL